MVTTVFNLKTGDTIEYSGLEPADAVIAAYAQYEQRNNNTWTYEQYRPLVQEGPRTFLLGDFSVFRFVEDEAKWHQNILDVRVVPNHEDTRIHCRACGDNSFSTRALTTCPLCGDARISVTTGTAIIVKTSKGELRLVPETAEARPDCLLMTNMIARVLKRGAGLL